MVADAMAFLGSVNFNYFIGMIWLFMQLFITQPGPEVDSLTCFHQDCGL